MANTHRKRPRSRASTPTTSSINVTEPSEPPHKTKKLKLHASYTLQSPFPDFTRPSPEEAQEVFNILSKAHSPDGVHRLEPSSSSTSSDNSAESCGNVPDVIEALIGTILSQNTSAKNSSAAKANLDAQFGRNNFAAIADAPRKEVVDAIRNGGLANKKAGTIQNILRSVKEKHGVYSLQHLASSSMENEEIMRELMSYDGVGPKTASCVLLFCLGRDSFAVDTHVYRLSRLLGWVPGKADKVLAQAHLDLRIPDELKYGLHVLMIQHGRVCKGCRKSASGNCVLKIYVGQRVG
ncbi:DNA glycosylase [Amanita rubescens]|nr:DNA glycosylase [Amanita rubescens]